MQHTLVRLRTVLRGQWVLPEFRMRHVFSKYVLGEISSPSPIVTSHTSAGVSQHMLWYKCNGAPMSGCSSALIITIWDEAPESM